jgi:hypothetical protein
VIHREVIGDLEQPGRKLVRAIVSLEVVERSDEHFLRQVFRQLAVSHHPIHEGEDGALESLDEFASRALVSLETQAHELLSVRRRC